MCMDLVFVKPKNKLNRNEWRGGPVQAGQRPYHYISTAISGDSGCLIDYDGGESHVQVGNSCANNHSNHVSRQSNIQKENKDLVLILQKLDELIAREDERERVDLFIKQWIEVAEIIDRFFFWIFVTGTAFVSLFLLTVYPTFKKDVGIIPVTT